ncbi:hypothetical protein DJ73_19235 [Halorubrum sp. Ea1]|nr:hypothetical protein DJ73_19235 [Halorubrum sp. Ea1]
MTMFDDETLSLSTTESRVRCPIAFPDADDGYQRQYIDSDGWGLTENTLTARDGDCVVHIGFRRSKDDNQLALKSGTVTPSAESPPTQRFSRQNWRANSHPQTAEALTVGELIRGALTCIQQSVFGLLESLIQV